MKLNHLSYLFFFSIIFSFSICAEKKSTTPFENDRFIKVLFLDYYYPIQQINVEQTVNIYLTFPLSGISKEIVRTYVFDKLGRLVHQDEYYQEQLYWTLDYNYNDSKIKRIYSKVDGENTTMEFEKKSNGNIAIRALRNSYAIEVLESPKNSYTYKVFDLDSGSLKSNAEYIFDDGDYLKYHNSPENNSNGDVESHVFHWDNDTLKTITEKITGRNDDNVIEFVYSAKSLIGIKHYNSDGSLVLYEDIEYKK